MGCGQTGTASPARAVAWPLQIDPFIGVGELALFVAMADCSPPPSGWSRGAYGLFIAAAVASMFGGPVRQKLTLGGDGGGVFDLDNRGAVTLTVTRATTPYSAICQLAHVPPYRAWRTSSTHLPGRARPEDTSEAAKHGPARHH